MKSKTITHFIVEGVDGVGKSTLQIGLLKHYNYTYICYDRGEISNWVYSQKFGRSFVPMERCLPYLYIVLTCDDKVLEDRMIKGGKESETGKILDQRLFEKAIKDFNNDYHLISIDTTKLNAEEVLAKCIEMIDDYLATLPADTVLTDWNKQYKIAYSVLGKNFIVRNNQPYVDGQLMMSESTNQNGNYEKFTDKSFPNNLTYSLIYNFSKKPGAKKDIDFSYVINSKIDRRPEVYEYYNAFINDRKSMLVSESVYLRGYNMYQGVVKMPRVFGQDFIEENARAKCTVYTARDLAYLKLQTARLYEAIMSNQIVFVDRESDPDCEILTQIHKNKSLVDILYVTPKNIVEQYNKIINDKDLWYFVLKNQREWYMSLRSKLCKNEKL